MVLSIPLKKVSKILQLFSIRTPLGDPSEAFVEQGKVMKDDQFMKFLHEYPFQNQINDHKVSFYNNYSLVAIINH